MWWSELREAMARQAFVDSISQIYSVALSSEVAKSGALVGRMTVAAAQAKPPSA